MVYIWKEEENISATVKVRNQKDVRDISMCLKNKLERKGDISWVKSSKNLGIFEYDHPYSVRVTQAGNFLKKTYSVNTRNLSFLEDAILCQQNKDLGTRIGWLLLIVVGKTKYVKVKKEQMSKLQRTDTLVSLCCLISYHKVSNSNNTYAFSYSVKNLGSIHLGSGLSVL